LTAIVDRLVGRLLATEAGELERLASHTTSSVEALRAYLEGQAAYRRGSYRDAVRHFQRALERDSSFAMAALGLAHAADRIGAQYDRARALAAAWAARGELTERDNVYLQAIVGPRYPAESSSREYVAAWERATTRIPDRADAWHELGERLFTDGRMLGLRDWETRAAAAFRRATELDPAFASPYQYLMQLAAAQGDSASVRRLALTYLRVDSAGELAPFVRWRSAIALGDSVRLRTLRRQLASFPAASLRSIVLSGQYNGIAAGDAERALEALTSRAARGAERAELLLGRHALSINRGVFGAALEVTERLGEDRAFVPVAQRLRVLDWLYAGANRDAGTSAALRLASRLAPADTTGSGVAVVSMQGGANTDDRCVLGQWHALTGGAEQADSARTLQLPAAVTPLGMLPEPCATLVDAISAVRARAPDAIQRVERLDSLLLFGPPAARMYDYVGLALSRLYEAAGDERRALAAVRRRPHMWQWPHYLATHLREEGRLSLAVGDSTGAVAAYRHYLALRPSPEGAARADVELVRAELARLTRTSD
jgi:tetratricopeptide (TPR) repeat protein